jgi:hypothetical protein
VRPSGSPSSPPVKAWVQVQSSNRDEHTLFSIAAIAGLAAATMMALFGLPPIDLHGVLHHLGIMDPLCGGTRAARFAAAGQWSQAWRYNPLGLLAVLAGAAAAVRALVGLLTGRWVTLRFGWTPRRRRVAIAVLVVVTVALTVRQQLRADLLIAGT